jgi:hypothetical protein
MDAAGARSYRSLVKTDWEGARKGRRLYGERGDQLPLDHKEKLLKSKINELENALAQIKTLRGLLPICSHCKKIRNDKGYWEYMEIYVRDHTEADFSHGICPECMEKFYPDHRKRE